MNIMLLGDCFPEARPDDLVSTVQACGADGLELRTGLSLPQSVTPENSVGWRHRLRHARLEVPALATQVEVGSDAPPLHSIDTAAHIAGDIGVPVIRLIPVSRDTDRLRADIILCTERHPGFLWALETTGAWAGPTPGLEDCWHDKPVWLWDLAHTLSAGEAPSETLGRLGLPVHVHVGHVDEAPLSRRALPRGKVHEAVRELGQRGYAGALSGEWLGWPAERSVEKITATVRLLREMSQGGS